MAHTVPSPFEIRGHTADIRLYVSGKTPEELFRNALVGMGEMTKPVEGPRPEEYTVHREVKVDSFDMDALLVDFLNEILYLSDTNDEVFRDVSFRKFSDTHLEAEIVGEKMLRPDKDIKAVTHHDLTIARRPDGYLETVVIFDI